MRTLFIDHFLHIVSRNYYFIGTFLAARFGMDVQMIVIEDYHKLLDGCNCSLCSAQCFAHVDHSAPHNRRKFSVSYAYELKLICW